MEIERSVAAVPKNMHLGGINARRVTRFNLSPLFSFSHIRAPAVVAFRLSTRVHVGKRRHERECDVVKANDVL
jgi:hypothetical protein